MTAPGQPDDFDENPVWGFREDIFEERLRRGFTLETERNRRYEENLSEEPDVWLSDARMSHTEVSLRLGHFLLQSPIVASNVVVTLAGYELTRTERPQFPVTRYLVERLGYAPKVNRRYKWRGHYSLPGVERRLVVTFDKDNGHVSVRLATGGRLIVFMSGGCMYPTKAAAERRMLRAAIGRAVVWPGAKPTDQLAICVPRSGAFRKAIEEIRRVNGLRRLGLHLLTIDRVTGTVGGWEEIDKLPEDGL